MMAMAGCLAATLIAAWFLFRSLRAKRVEAAYEWPGEAKKGRFPEAKPWRGTSVDLPLVSEAEALEPPRERRRSLAALRAELSESP